MWLDKFKNQYTKQSSLTMEEFLHQPSLHEGYAFLGGLQIVRNFPLLKKITKAFNTLPFEVRRDLCIKHFDIDNRHYSYPFFLSSDYKLFFLKKPEGFGPKTMRGVLDELKALHVEHNPEGVLILARELAYNIEQFLEGCDFFSKRVVFHALKKVLK